MSDFSQKGNKKDWRQLFYVTVLCIINIETVSRNKLRRRKVWLYRKLPRCIWRLYSD